MAYHAMINQQKQLHIIREGDEENEDYNYFDPQKGKIIEIKSFDDCAIKSKATENNKSFCDRSRYYFSNYDGNATLLPHD
jgi:hypothetical protein